MRTVRLLWNSRRSFMRSLEHTFHILVIPAMVDNTTIFSSQGLLIYWKYALISSWRISSNFTEVELSSLRKFSIDFKDWEKSELGIAVRKKHFMFCSVELLCSHDLLTLRWCPFLFCSCPPAVTSDDFTENWILSLSPTFNDLDFFLYLPIMDFGSTLLFLLMLLLLSLFLLLLLPLIFLSRRVVELSSNFSLPYLSCKYFAQALVFRSHFNFCLSPRWS